MRSKKAALVVCSFIWASSLAGPLKYLSGLLGFPIHLLPKALLFLLIAATFASFQANPRQWAITAAIAASAVVGLEHHLPPAQVAFGLWALLPFFYGLLFPEIVLSERVRNSLLGVFAICAVGEVLSYVTVFPWSGMNVEFGGVSTMAAREWYSGSARRLAGFTTSSIDLSLLLGMLGIFFIFKSGHFLTRSLLLLLVAGLIFATTMKTAVLAFVLACLPLLAPSRFLRIGIGAVGLAFMALGIVIPFMLKADYLGIARWVRRSHLESLQERFGMTWPAVLEYLRQAGAGAWGVGLGGLGSATSVGRSPFVFASVDNFYLYLIGTGGLLGCFLLFVFARRLCSEAVVARTSRIQFRLPLLAFFAIYGFTQPLVEVSVSALFMGALLAAERRGVRAASRLAVPQRQPIFPRYGAAALPHPLRPSSAHE
jgi:hypothetical protein